MRHIVSILGVDQFYHVLALFCHTTLLGKNTVTCSASQPLFLFWVSLPSLVSPANAKTITAETNRLDSSQHLIHNLPVPPVLRCDCVLYPKGHLGINTLSGGFQKVRLCVSVAAQRAVSLFSLTEPQVGGPDMRPVVSPVQFHTPQTPRTTPTFSG